MDKALALGRSQAAVRNSRSTWWRWQSHLPRSKQAISFRGRGLAVYGDVKAGLLKTALIDYPHAVGDTFCAVPSQIAAANATSAGVPDRVAADNSPALGRRNAP